MDGFTGVLAAKHYTQDLGCFCESLLAAEHYMQFLGCWVEILLAAEP